MTTRIGCTFFVLASTVISAAEDTKVEEPGFLANLITLLLPVIIVVVVFLLLTRGSGRRAKTAMDNSIDSMELSKKQNERIIELLEQINDKLGSRSEQKPPPLPSESGEA
jgi:hypothetical protein